MTTKSGWRIRVVNAAGRAIFDAPTSGLDEAERLAECAISLRHDVKAFVSNPCGERAYWFEPGLSGKE